MSQTQRQNVAMSYCGGVATVGITTQNIINPQHFQQQEIKQYN